MANYLGAKDITKSKISEDPRCILDWDEAQLSAVQAVEEGQTLDFEQFKYYKPSIIEDATQGVVVPTKELEQRYLYLWCGFALGPLRRPKRARDDSNEQ